MGNYSKTKCIRILLGRRDFLVKKISSSHTPSVIFDIQEVKALEWALKTIRKLTSQIPDSTDNLLEIVNELVPEDRFKDRKGVVTHAFKRIENQKEAIDIKPDYVEAKRNKNEPLKASDFFFETD